MWENASKKETQQVYPTPVVNLKRAAKKDGLLLVQCVLCAAVIAFVLFVRAASPDGLKALQESYEDALEQGIVFDGDTDFVRLANAAVANVRRNAEEWVASFAPAPEQSFDVGTQPTGGAGASGGVSDEAPQNQSAAAAADENAKAATQQAGASSLQTEAAAEKQGAQSQPRTDALQSNPAASAEALADAAAKSEKAATPAAQEGSAQTAAKTDSKGIAEATTNTEAVNNTAAAEPVEAISLNAPQNAIGAQEFALPITGAAPRMAYAAQPPQGASDEPYTLPEQLTQPAWGVLSDGYGYRKSPITGKKEFHMGIDIAAEKGAPVYCALDGQVVEAGWNRERGFFLVVHHRAGLETLYQHLSFSLARAGELVKAGETIALVGDTGLVTGPHLHFELILDGLRADPLPQFPALEATA